MHFHSFMKLIGMIDPLLDLNATISNKQTGKKPIITENGFYCLLKWLAGDSYLDIWHLAGILFPLFYQIMHKYIIAILCCDALSYSFPTEKEKVVDTIKEFKVLSSHGVIDGCVGYISSLLLQI